MAGVFISWGSSDKTIAEPIIRRLRSLLSPPPGSGLPRLYEYSDDMAAGDIIAATVIAWIESSTVAVLCLSDETAKRFWVKKEIAWLESALLRNKIDIVPIQVGPLDRGALPPEVTSLFNPALTNVPDHSTGSEEALVKLARDLFAKLSKKPQEFPKLLPIAVISMDTKEANDQFANWSGMVAASDDAPLWDICRAVGMQGPTEVFNILTERYGARAEDLMPFGSDSLREIIQAGIDQANANRAERPILARWIHGELTSSDAKERERARAVWRAHDSVLIVDLLSIFNSKAHDRLSLVPQDAPRVAAVCLPPYTRLTGPVDDALANLVNTIPYSQVEPWFRKWSTPVADAMVTFDMSTRIALRSWLNRKLTTLPADDSPDGAAVDAMGASEFKGTPGAAMTGAKK